MWGLIRASVRPGNSGHAEAACSPATSAFLDLIGWIGLVSTRKSLCPISFARQAEWTHNQFSDGFLTRRTT